MSSIPQHDGSLVGVINCPDCGPDQPARVLVRGEDHRAVMVCCLGCDRFFRAEDVAWRER